MTKGKRLRDDKCRKQERIPAAFIAAEVCLKTLIHSSGRQREETGKNTGSIYSCSRLPEYHNTSCICHPDAGGI
jgi:hypothetical protein